MSPVSPSNSYYLTCWLTISGAQIQEQQRRQRGAGKAAWDDQHGGGATTSATCGVFTRSGNELSTRSSPAMSSGWPLLRACDHARRYALTGKEVVSILMQRLVRVDGKVRTDCTYPAGFMDVIDIEKTDEHFRLIYDSKGRFVTHRITKVGRAPAPLFFIRMRVRGGAPVYSTHAVAAVLLAA